MNRIHLAVALGSLLLIAAGLPIVRALIAQDNPDQQHADALHAQIDALNKQVLKLEARIAALEQQQRVVYVPTAPAPHYTLPPATPRFAPQLPKGAVPREFNGGQYYIVPLAQPPADTAAPNR